MLLKLFYAFLDHHIPFIRRLFLSSLLILPLTTQQPSRNTCSSLLDEMKFNDPLILHTPIFKLSLCECKNVLAFSEHCVPEHMLSKYQLTLAIDSQSCSFLCAGRYKPVKVLSNVTHRCRILFNSMYCW